MTFSDLPHIVDTQLCIYETRHAFVIFCCSHKWYNSAAAKWDCKKRVSTRQGNICESQFYCCWHDWLSYGQKGDLHMKGDCLKVGQIAIVVGSPGPPPPLDSLLANSHQSWRWFTLHRRVKNNENRGTPTSIKEGKKGANTKPPMMLGKDQGWKCMFSTWSYFCANHKKSTWTC